MRKILFLLCVCSLHFVALAESPPQGEDDILRPVPWRMYVGPYAGGAWVVSNGRFETLCDCEYLSGQGFGLQLGAFADYPLTRDLSVFATLGYRMLRPSFEKSEQRLEYVPFGGGGDFMWVDFDLETAVLLSVVELGVAAKWNLPVRGLYVAVGPELGIIIDDNITEIEHIRTPGLTYDTNGGTEQTFMDGNMADYYSDAASYRLGLAARLGYIYPLHERLAVAPELMMTMPLTPVTSTYADWKLATWQFNLYLRFAI